PRRARAQPPSESAITRTRAVQRIFFFIRLSLPRNAYLKVQPGVRRAVFPSKGSTRFPRPGCDGWRWIALPAAVSPLLLTPAGARSFVPRHLAKFLLRDGRGL